MLNLFLIIFLSSTFAKPATSTEIETVSAFQTLKTNRKLVDAILQRVPEKERKAVQSFVATSNLKLEQTTVHVQPSGNGFRFVAADGRVTQIQTIDAIRGQFRLAGLPLDMDRRRSAMERFTQIENVLSRKEAGRSALFVPAANAYVISGFAAVIVGIWFVIDEYQKTSQVRAFYKANTELKFARNDCQSELKKTASAKIDQASIVRAHVRAPELLSAKQHLNKISSLYICRDSQVQPATPEGEKIAEGCEVINEINQCIQEIAARTELGEQRTASIAVHADKAVQHVSWRADMVEVLRGSNQRASSR